MHRHRFLALATATLAATLAAAPAFNDRPAAAGEWGARPAEGSVCRETPPAFVWRPQPKTRAYDLQYARAADFADAVTVTGLVRNVHRPARPLAAGAWRWRVRAWPAKGKAPTDWTAPRAFTIAPDAKPCPLPPLDELLARIPAGHPRLFMRPETLAAYRAGLTTTYAVHWKRLQATCRKLLKNPPPTAEPLRYAGDETVSHSEAWKKRWWGNARYSYTATQAASLLAFRWRLDGDAASGALAKRILLDVLKWEPKGASGYRYNDEAGMPYFSYVSRTYSFLYDMLSEDERAACREVMRVRGDEMFRHLYPRILWTPYASHSQRAWHYLGEGALAFYGEIPETRLWLEHVIDTYACVYPVWGDDDGGWQEGTGYWSSYTGRFLRWNETMRQALGVNAFEKPFYANAGDYILYQEIPGGRGPGFADCANGTRAGFFSSLMRVLAAHAQNPSWQWHAEADPQGRRFEDAYVEFARATLPVPPATPPADIPQSKLFRGTGLAAMNKTLLAASNNVQVLFKCSPTFGTVSHGYDANNSFNLNAFGERLFVHSGERDCYGSPFHRDWMWHTKSCNSVTAGGASQIRHSYACTGTITEFTTSPELDVVTGSLGDVYEGSNVTRFVRTIYFRKTFPEAVLVVDRLEAKSPTTFEWWLHTTKEPFAIPNQHDVVAKCGNASARVDFLWPEGLALSQTDAFDPPIAYGLKLVQHHLTAATVQPATHALFVTLIAPYRTGTPPPPKAKLEKTSSSFRVTWPVAGAVPWTVDIPRAK